MSSKQKVRAPAKAKAPANKRKAEEAQVEEPIFLARTKLDNKGSVKVEEKCVTVKGGSNLSPLRIKFQEDKEEYYWLWEGDKDVKQIKIVLKNVALMNVTFLENPVKTKEGKEFISKKYLFNFFVPNDADTQTIISKLHAVENLEGYGEVGTGEDDSAEYILSEVENAVEENVKIPVDLLKENRQLTLESSGAFPNFYLQDGTALSVKDLFTEPKKKEDKKQFKEEYKHKVAAVVFKLKGLFTNKDKTKLMFSTDVAKVVLTSVPVNLLSTKDDDEL